MPGPCNHRHKETNKHTILAGNPPPYLGGYYFSDTLLVRSPAFRLQTQIQPSAGGLYSLFCAAFTRFFFFPPGDGNDTGVVRGISRFISATVRAEPGSLIRF